MLNIFQVVMYIQWNLRIKDTIEETSLYWTKCLVPMFPLFRGYTVYTYKSVVEEVDVHVTGGKSVLLDLSTEVPGHFSQCLSPITRTQYQHSVHSCSNTHIII